MATTPNTPFTVEPPLVPFEPTSLRAGDSWTWQRVFDGYPSGGGWTAQYILNSAQARFAFPSTSATAALDGFGFNINVAAGDTATVATGAYELYVVLSNAGLAAQQTFLLQRVMVQPNIFTAALGVDTRSFAKRTLDMIEAAISGDVSAHVQEYEINGRRIQYMDRMKLAELRDKYKYEVRQEQIAAGEYTPKRRVGVFFRPNY